MTSLADADKEADTLFATSAISPSEVRWYLSNPGASIGYSGNGTPATSLGGWMSVTQLSSTPLDNLFGDITIAQNDAGQVDYRCVFVANFTATGYMMKQAFVWLPQSAYIPAGASLAVGVDPSGVVPYQSTHQQAAIIANSLTAPPVTTWYGPSIIYNLGLPITDVPPGYAVGIWLKRTATNSVAYTPQQLALQVAFVSDLETLI